MRLKYKAKLYYYVMNKSPLRYPGGKTRACKKLFEIVNNNYDLSKFDTIVSPFFGGGSFEFYLNKMCGLQIIANDKFKPLFSFWKNSKTNNDELCDKLYPQVDTINKEAFATLRKSVIDEENELEQSVMYFIINRCSFSGATLSGGFSQEASKKRFTKSSVDRIKKLDLSKFDIFNHDFEEFIQSKSNCMFFVDPPYFLEKGSNLYGKNGDLHENFDHERLHKCITTKKNWCMTYNNCEYIRELYKDFKIIETSWSYGMNKSKQSSEIVILG